MIIMKGISKTYRVRKREAGIGNAVKALFSRKYTEVPALKNMTFTIPDGQIVGCIPLNRRERRGQKHHHQNPLRHSPAGLRPVHRKRHGALGEPEGICGKAGGCLRTADTAVVGCAGHRLLPAAEGHLPGTR